MITIYTDGASRGNPGPGGWAAIILGEDTVTEIGGREAHTTNNKMELTAAIRALETTAGDSMQINTDSEYVMKGITEWIKTWQLKNWRTAAKKQVLNQVLWQRLLELTEGKNIEWKYVPGHAGVNLNERADAIATSFADNIKIDLYDGPKHGYRYK